jgi:5-formyltetrahydrofolate cyclo-ligase
MANHRSQFSDKSQLRDTLRERLQKLSLTERHTRSLLICEKLLPYFSGKNSLALFAPMSTEPDLDLLWDHGALVEHSLLSYPRREGETLSFHPISALAELIPGRFGIREPAPSPSPKQLDLIVVPGLAFSAQGNRLGRGAGFYDRFLATLPQTTFKLGVCFEFQRVSSIPHEPHDVTMDAVVSG